MDKHPLSVIQKIDGELFNRTVEQREFTFRDGALSGKIKTLIALALDASLGADHGVVGLTRQALEKGASRQEVAEALHVAGYIAGAHAVYTAARALDQVFKD
jgi:alkylhydroperoxidase/carboxymuconolactone decarboxylase family protein YurZ